MAGGSAFGLVEALGPVLSPVRPDDDSKVKRGRGLGWPPTRTGEKMKVWVVMAGAWYDRVNIESVFSTKELAEAFCEKHSTREPPYWAEEWEVLDVMPADPE